MSLIFLCINIHIKSSVLSFLPELLQNFAEISRISGRRQCCCLSCVVKSIIKFYISKHNVICEMAQPDSSSCCHKTGIKSVMFTNFVESEIPSTKGHLSRLKSELLREGRNFYVHPR